MPVFLLILCLKYFSCLQMYSEIFLTFNKQMFFGMFVAKGDTSQFFEK